MFFLESKTAHCENIGITSSASIFVLCIKLLLLLLFYRWMRPFEHPRYAEHANNNNNHINNILAKARQAKFMFEEVGNGVLCRRSERSVLFHFLSHIWLASETPNRIWMMHDACCSNERRRKNRFTYMQNGRSCSLLCATIALNVCSKNK